MGYCIYQAETKFRITAKNKAAALQAIKGLEGEEPPHPHLAWVETADFLKAETLEDALKVWRWHPKVDEKGNITDLEFTGEKYGDCILMFGAIAPYVKSGSFITMKGEDGAIFRWLFNKKEVKEQEATITVEWY